MTTNRVITGLERLVLHPPAWMRRARLGLLANQASVGPRYEHAADLIDRALPGRLAVLLGPQHGFAGEKQDNMVESDHGLDRSGRAVYSLYGETRKPTPAMFDGLDALVVDLVDVGTRVYTFAQTLAYSMEAAGRAGIRVVVLDRPNPIGGREVEGNLLTPECASFVGLYPLPMRHGLTLGELALFMAERMNPRPELTVVRMEGWRRDMYFRETGLPWVWPSPNMPMPETAWVYPGQVIWEGTNLSEARGTTRPFHLCGAPFIDPFRLRDELDGAGLEGAVFRPVTFEPTFHKFQGRVCHGVEIHPIDPKTFRPYRTTLTLLAILMRWRPDQVAWRPPPYEYEYDRLAIDLILGDRRVREGLEAGRPVREIEAGWQPELDRFIEDRQRFLLYG